jgi:glycosyltransferase involved in cell wall biosynthesis
MQQAKQERTMMRILFCCQFYAPSIGGVQEVIRQIAERLATLGHQVSVATTKLTIRDFDELNGVAIHGFNVKGNLASGMSGEIREYQEFVLNGGFNVVMIYAAQQWTFDALWPVLEKLKSAKVFVPCGFSGLYEPGYARYFQDIPDVLRKFEHLIFNATAYRDIDFVRKHGMDKFSILPNGASELEFGVSFDSEFRVRHSIPQQSFVFLTVGSFTGLKGHQELVNAFARLSLPGGRHATLILNGNEVTRLETGAIEIIMKIIGLAKTHGAIHMLRQTWKKIVGSGSSPRAVAESINRHLSNKRVLVTDLARTELIQAYMAADLFVFASNIEYSPLVLFESAAAGTPFLSVDVGNAIEIAKWTGAGITCPSAIDEKGYTRVDEKVLAQAMESLMNQTEFLEKLGATGKQNWCEHYTWNKVATQYEQLFHRLTGD